MNIKLDNALHAYHVSSKFSHRMAVLPNNTDKTEEKKEIINNDIDNNTNNLGQNFDLRV